jgi:myosin V
MNGHYPHEPVITELQGRITKAEAVLRDKEEENVMLKQQLEQYESKWSEYEAKMKSMEEAWKRQLSSLQVIMFIIFMYACKFEEWVKIFLQHEFIC